MNAEKNLWGLVGMLFAGIFLCAIGGGVKHVMGVDHLLGGWAIPFALGGCGLGYLLGRAAA